MAVIVCNPVPAAAAASEHAHQTSDAQSITGDFLRTSTEPFPVALDTTSGLLTDTSNNNFSVVQQHHQQQLLVMLLAEDVVCKMAVFVCACGLIGNVFNLVVLSRKSLTRSMERMELSAHCGLVALAVSDALFCLAVLPSAFQGSQEVFGFVGFGFRIFYAVFANGLINTFIVSSTWLTVVMAISRYLAICHPIRARIVIGKRFTGVSLAVVVIGCVLLNVPRYFHFQIETVPCAEGGTFYYKVEGPLQRSPFWETIYYWTYFVVATTLPFLLLTFCNAQLIRALRGSERMRAMSYVRGYHDDMRARAPANRRVTLTLIVIVCLYVPLVVPTEIMTFLREAVVRTMQHVDSFNLILAVFNLLQSINFSINFLLYCVIHTHFRQTFFRMFLFQNRRGAIFRTSSSSRLETVSTTI